MSDTDDTDDLLLIPPDFFLINSDIEDSLQLYGSYYSVVDDLITHVNTLEDRINHIESHSDTSLLNSSLNSADLMTGVRRFSSLDELSQPAEAYPGSAQSTPQKPKTKLHLHSLPSTPHVDPKKSPIQQRVYSRYGRNTKQKVANQSGTNLEEINSFISHVKNIQKHEAVRNLNHLFESMPVCNADGGKGSNETKKIEASDTTIKTLWECENVRNNRPDNYTSAPNIGVEPFVKSKKLLRAGDMKGSVPNRGMGMRDTLYNNAPNVRNTYSLSSTASQPVSTSDLLSGNSEYVFSDTSSFSSSDSTQLTTVHKSTSETFDQIHINAVNVLEKHKKNTSQASADAILDKELQHRKKVEYLRKDLALISLSELWNQNGAGDYNRDHKKFINKLQEEKLRRLHCEDLIRQLQERTLELQQRIAVAIQVDGAKDETILRIHQSWEDAANKIDTLHKEKTHLELQLSEANSKTSTELLEAAKKVSHYESESSKALNLAHTNQEKVAILEKQNISLQAELQICEDKLKKFEVDLSEECDRNHQLSKILSQRDIELNENKNVQAQATKEIAQSKHAVEICQVEVTSIKAKQAQIETKYNETLVHIKELENDKKKLLADIENYKKAEKSLKTEMGRINETQEKGKAELRQFYQNQVEILVREKLKEFQQQLEKAETLLQDEMRSRELVMAKNAATHIQQINEKNILEIHLLDEKHKEEMKLNKLQLFQAQQEINNLQQKFQQQQERRTNIVQQLQKVMEAQWSEALKIINNGKSPVVAQDKSTNTIDQLNHLKSRSYNNLEEILMSDDPHSKDVPKHKGSSATNFKMFESLSIDDFYNKIVETPVSSRPEKHKNQGENELQKYIQMLLNKQPGHPNDEQQANSHENYDNQTPTDVTKLNRGGGGAKEHLSKRPWK